MKTNEQIKLAKEMIQQLNDYVELSKVEKKVKNNDNKEQINKVISNITENLKLSMEEL